MVPGPPSLQTVQGAAAAGDVKEEVQLVAFLESRGWRVAFCVEATVELWRLASARGVLAENVCALSIKQRWPFQPNKLLVQQAGMIEDLLIQSGLRREHAVAIRECSGSSHACQSDYPGDVADVRMEAFCCPRVMTFRVLDIGCGSGRDLAWLATRNSILRVPHSADEQVMDVRVAWECVGLDSWHGALQRAAEVLALGEVPAGPGGVTLHLVQIGPGAGDITPLPLPPTANGAGQLQVLRRYLANPHLSTVPHEYNWSGSSEAGSRDSSTVSALGRFDLLLCVRFLERSFLQNMPKLLKPGGVILFSTFVDGPGLRKFGRPQGRDHVLQPDELAKSFFGPQQGFKVLLDEVETIFDGREISMFCARKLPIL